MLENFWLEVDLIIACHQLHEGEFIIRGGKVIFSLTELSIQNTQVLVLMMMKMSVVYLED